METRGTWSDEATRALLESRIEKVKQRLTAAADLEERAKLRKSVEQLEELHNTLYSEPKAKRMSEQQVRELLEKAIQEDND